MLLTLTRVLTLRTKNTCKNDYNNNSKNKSNNGNSTVLSRAMRGHATAFEIRTTMRFIFFFFFFWGGGLESQSSGSSCAFVVPAQLL